MSDTNQPVKQRVEQQIYLAVPYEQRKEALQVTGSLDNGRTALGFDKDKGLWFAKQGADLEKVSPWLPNPQQFSIPTAQDPTLEFSMVLESAGLVLNEPPMMDGKIHRVKTVDDKSGKKSAAYAGFNDGHPTGWYQDHRNHSEPQKWSASMEQSDPLARLHIKAHLANRSVHQKQIDTRKHQHNGKRCNQVFQLMPTAAAKHPYLQRKGVQPYPDVCQDKKGRLVIPLVDEHQRIHSLQRISGNGFKSLKKGAQKSGNFFVVGHKPLTNGEPILHAEGYSTAASIAEATGRSVVMTVDAGNMPKVAEKLKAVYPESGHLFLADDDRKNQINKGVEKARESAEITKGHWLTPAFIVDEVEHGMTDFNDLHISRGLDTVKQQVEQYIERCWPELSQTKPEQLTSELNSIELYERKPEVDENPNPTRSIKPCSVNAKLDHSLKVLDNYKAQTAANETVADEKTQASKPQITTAHNPNFDLPTNISKSYISVENKYYFRNRPETLAFVDKGLKLQTRHVHVKVVSDLINIASSRNWSELKLSGSQAFKREAWYQAKMQGIKVKGYRPDEIDQKRLAQSESPSKTLQASLIPTPIPIKQSESVKPPELNEVEATKVAQEFSANLSPQKQKVFMSKVKQWMKTQIPKFQVKTQDKPPELVRTNPKQQENDYELER